MSTIATPTLDNPGNVVTRPAKLAHVVLRTSNYERLSEFYRVFLNADVNFENEFMKLLSYDTEHHRIGIVNVDGIGPKDTQTNGLEHIAFTYSSLTDLALAYLQRKAHGIMPFWCINHGPTTSVYYRDPDGNTLESQVENFDTVIEAAEYITSEAYKINPLGVDFEMEDLIQRIRAGENEASLKKRPESGPRSLDTVPA